MKMHINKLIIVLILFFSYSFSIAQIQYSDTKTLFSANDSKIEIQVKIFANPCDSNNNVRARFDLIITNKEKIINECKNKITSELWNPSQRIYLNFKMDVVNCLGYVVTKTFSIDLFALAEGLNNNVEWKFNAALFDRPFYDVKIDNYEITMEDVVKKGVVKSINKTRPDNLDNVDLNNYTLSGFDVFPSFARVGGSINNYPFRFLGYGEHYLIGANLFNWYRTWNCYVYDLHERKFGEIKENNFGILDKYAEKGKVYVSAGSVCNPSLVKFSKESYDKPEYYKPAGTISYCPGGINWFDNYEEKIDGRIFSFTQKKSKPYYGKKQGEVKSFDFIENFEYIACQQMDAAHDENSYLLMLKWNKKKLININNIIDNNGNLSKIYSGYGVVDTRKSYTWDIDKIKYLKNDKFLLKINVEGSFTRHMSNEVHGLTLDVKHESQISIVFDDNFNVIAVNDIINGDISIVTDFWGVDIEILKDGASVVCYDEQLRVKWSNSYGVKDIKTGDIINFAKVIGNSLFLMGTTKNKLHYGIEDPCIWEIDISNGKLIRQKVIEMKKTPAHITGFFLSSNRLYTIIDEAVIVYGCEIKKSSNNIIKSVNSIPTTNIEIATIGSQKWQKNNLDVSNFNNGDFIKECKTASQWIEACKNEEPAWCYYANDEITGKKYGRIYNLYALSDNRGLAPDGFRIPNDNDFKELLNSPTDDIKRFFSFGGMRDEFGKFESIFSSSHYWAIATPNYMSSNMYYNINKKEFERGGSNKCEGFYIKLIRK